MQTFAFAAHSPLKLSKERLWRPRQTQESEGGNPGSGGMHGAACRVPTNEQGDMPFPSTWQPSISGSRHCFFKKSFFLEIEPSRFLAPAALGS